MILAVKNLQKTFDKLKAIDNINLNIYKNDIVAIMGASGSGKTTLLNIIAGITTDYDGEIEKNCEKIGYVFQESRTLPWLTVYENIKIVRRKENKTKIMELIELVGLKGFEHNYPHTLSGGMRQRCSIARSFYYGSDLLLMDEAFKSLDYKLRLDMIKNIINIWRNEQNSILLVTHDIDEALTIAKRIIILSERPSKILKEFTINADNFNRDLSSPELIKLRKNIMELIL